MFLRRVKRFVARAVRASGGYNDTNPLEYHREHAIEALSEGVAATYGCGIAGDVAEFGTMTGETAAGLARAIARCDTYLGGAMQSANLPLKRLHLFDSFAGLPSATNPTDAQSPHVRDGVWSPGSCKGITPAELTQKVTRYLAAERVQVFPGWFSDTVPVLPDGTSYGLVHVDSDLYVSAMDVLSGLFARGMITEGALIYFDDWNCNAASNDFGERRAWRECVARYKIEFSDEGRYGIFAHRFTVHSYAVPDASS